MNKKKVFTSGAISQNGEFMSGETSAVVINNGLDKFSGKDTVNSTISQVTAKIIPATEGIKPSESFQTPYEEKKPTYHKIKIVKVK